MGQASEHSKAGESERSGRPPAKRFAPVQETVEPTCERLAAEAESDAACLSAVLQRHLGNGLVLEALEGGGGELGVLIGAELGAAVAGIGPSGAARSEFLSTANGERAKALTQVPRTREEALEAMRGGGGQRLPAAVATKLEREFGTTFDTVRIHTDEGAAQAARALGAQAVQQGEHLFFAEGAYAPDSVGGMGLLRHELTHVVQGREGRLPTTGQVSDPQMAAEREAVANEQGRRGAEQDDFEALWLDLVDATLDSWGGTEAVESDAALPTVSEGGLGSQGPSLGSSFLPTPSVDAAPLAAPVLAAPAQAQSAAPAMLSPDTSAEIEGGGWSAGDWAGTFDRTVEFLGLDAFFEPRQTEEEKAAERARVDLEFREAIRLADPMVLIRNTLDVLMAEERLDPKAIATVRELTAMLPEAEQGPILSELQSKVIYRNQRNNASTRERSCGGTCNVTALAMGLSYLGVPNPDPTKQYEDALIDIADEIGVSLTSGYLYSKVAEKLGLQGREVAIGVRDRDFYESTMAGWLAGKAVIASIRGHIVRIEAVIEEGVRVDDPYGASRLVGATKRSWKDEEGNSLLNGREADGTCEGNQGEDNVWPWEAITQFDLPYVAILG